MELYSVQWLGQIIEDPALDQSAVGLRAAGWGMSGEAAGARDSR